MTALVPPTTLDSLMSAWRAAIIDAHKADMRGDHESAARWDKAASDLAWRHAQLLATRAAETHPAEVGDG